MTDSNSNNNPNARPTRPARPLGKNGPPLPRVGYGAMTLDGLYGAVAPEDAQAALQRALDNGMMIDTADAYGGGANEERIAAAIAGRRADAFLATKFGIVFGENESGREFPTGWGFSLTINGSPEYVRRALDASLRRLGTDRVDLYYAHFPDPGVPIEETVGAMADGVRAGKIRLLGLSNVAPEQVRRAAAVHPIAAVQYEYSLWRREAEAELLPACREVGAALAAWSPLGAGFLAGEVNMADDDFRRNLPRFADDNLAKNRDRFAPLRDIAARAGCTTAQLALAWLLRQGDDIFPIPGTRRPARIDENLQAANIALTDDMTRELDALCAPGAATGATLI